MRLAEAAGLLKADIQPNHEIPHVSLKPHAWRQLKTASEIADVLGGWTSKSIGGSYGKGYDMPVLQRWMKRLEE